MANPNWLPKIDLDRLQDLLEKRKGITEVEIAREFNCHPATVTRAMKKLKRQYPMGVYPYQIQRATELTINYIDELIFQITDLHAMDDEVKRFLEGDKSAIKALEKIMISKAKEAGSSTPRPSTEGQDIKGKDGSGKVDEKAKVEKKIEKMFFMHDPRMIRVAIKKEIREYLGLYYQSLGTIGDKKAMAFYLKHIIDILGELSPELREKFVQRMRADHPARTELILKP
jgi:hypothetical protein